jgi:hypothetical protein
MGNLQTYRLDQPVVRDGARLRVSQGVDGLSTLTVPQTHQRVDSVAACSQSV